MTIEVVTPDRRVFQRVVEYVERGIASGEIKPGDRLPSERELGEKFGIGRASVREGLRILEHMEIIRSRPRDPRGPVVLPPSLEPVRRSVGLLTTYGYLDVAELVELRMIVDSSACLLAALRRTDDQLVAMERNMARMRESIPLGRSEFSLVDLEFHELVARAGGNKLVRLYGNLTRESVVKLIQQPIINAADGNAQMLHTLRHHRAVFDAIAARDGARASRLVRESLYEYYGDYVGDADRAVLAELVRQCGGTAGGRVSESSDDHGAN
ncbi:FadR/GntR family transcriptional regulator [Nocardia jiangxiensis]|uniref:FadR/GntR family transcriptional regulator n=1 Tax=Nocardia jiangxiensis TaxID=282685 RepID=UPI00031A7700|nr:FCD domain-containing protein [Nocardia jiangxiensis]